MLENINLVFSILASIVSIIFAILAFCEKRKCEQIKRDFMEIVNNINGNNNTISNNNSFTKIGKIDTFDNRKNYN